jgi:hypothetical protein
MWGRFVTCQSSSAMAGYKPTPQADQSLSAELFILHRSDQVVLIQYAGKKVFRTRKITNRRIGQGLLKAVRLHHRPQSGLASVTSAIDKHPNDLPANNADIRELTAPQLRLFGRRIARDRQKATDPNHTIRVIRGQRLFSLARDASSTATSHRSIPVICWGDLRNERAGGHFEGSSAHQQRCSCRDS